MHHEDIARHQVPGRDRYIEVTRCVETGQYAVALRDDKDHTYSGRNYGSLVLVSTALPTEAVARLVASAYFAAQRESADIQRTAVLVTAAKVRAMEATS